MIWSWGLRSFLGDTEHFTGKVDGFDGIFAVAIGADFRGEAVGDGCATDEDFDLVADTGGFEGFDGDAHGVHGGGEEGGHGDEVDAFIADGGDEFLGVDIDAEVEDFEAAAFEHGGDEVFTDIVEVTFDGADGNGSDGFSAGGGEEGADEFEGGFHGPGGEEEFGHEVIAAFEALADLVHGRGHVFID
ncbi:MAG: hypothetical protein RI897_142 [Verrucomicrobiota bacterium]